MPENSGAMDLRLTDFREKYRLADIDDTERNSPPDQNGMQCQNKTGQTKRKCSKYKRPTMDVVLTEFSDSTTLHGLRYIAMSDAFFFRRSVWFLLVLVCSGVMTFQIVDRIMYYYDNPVNVNVKINYNQSLYFPAVTLCNQNTFRATAATDQDWYRLIESMYKKPLINFNVSLLETHNVSRLVISDLFWLTGHKKDDLIVKCSWGDIPCGPENFTAVLTDHGLCYTFNSDIDPASTLVTSSSGSDAGLRLLLNVEQYEYMPGPSSAAGVKILTHGQRDLARVRELGISVPTGTHAFVGLQVIALENLPPPHGQCSEKGLTYFDYYTFDSCRLECLMSYINSQCGCRDFYMPSVNDEPRICSLKEYFSCFLPTKQKYLLLVQTGSQQCTCPTSCKSLMFDPTLSYATTSRHAVDKILDKVITSKITEKLTKAREVTHRMEQAKLEKFQTVVSAVNDSLSAVMVLIHKDMRKRIAKQVENVEKESERMMVAWKEKDFLYRYQEYNVRKNFIRGRDAMEERTLNLLCIGFHEFVFLTETYLQDLASDSFESNADGRLILYTILVAKINDRIETAKRALSNYTELYKAYQTGTPLFRYKFLGVARKHNPMIAPKILLNASLYHNHYARLHSPRVKDDIEAIIACLLEYIDFLNEVMQTSSLNTTRMATISEDYVDACERFYHSKSVFYYESIERPLRVILTRRDKFNKAKTQYLATIKNIKDNLLQLDGSLETMSNSTLHVFSDLVDRAVDYFTDQTVRKLDVAKMAEEEKVHTASISLKMFFQEVRSRGHAIYDGWTVLTPTGQSIWKMILEDEEMLDYYVYRNITDFLANSTKVYYGLELNYTIHRDTNDIRFIVGLRDSHFHSCLDQMEDHLSNYVTSTQVDHNVIMDNYLQLDIFYREMNYEEIRQQKAYDIFSLLCDIGGSMGLFVGASVMTIFEIIDLFLNHSAERLLRQNKR
ncbi:degenerin-like protein del-10 [Mizuhopecten yessoensis]|uniref:Acid-sensing ion channel 2 n=1 Tax=Mizuhopecten yessoensis TaxID=6573 RepID=A0A210PXP9_MIZYE|nr:degenerin-like protein del-10 [Mizuhopecten yessoensis]XP_021372637.1 degenerin-like protein del-10 [Mizuhopecten yessoensis]XP_021372638.1 degenerin-like protein del-10 [Mizuhopecten yessoensis]XP_021372639.1 degenerin-like protein del-10 [Mizuhopecten yessoensis]OWF41244.1 Acid-sensing ion channel 2 [Mizuhopecten yessoensis]